jgi:hypothetical protein
MIIGIGGKAQAGKDTTAMMLQTLIPFPNVTWDMYWNSDIVFTYDHFVVHYADLLKEVSQDMLNMPFDNFNSQEVKQSKIEWLDMTVREFLQKFGTAVRKEIDPDFWVKALFNVYNDANIIVADVRFPNEAEAVKERGGILIRINRPGAGAGNHISETALDNYDGWDYVIENTGTLEDLYNKVKEIVIDLK